MDDYVDTNRYIDNSEYKFTGLVKENSDTNKNYHLFIYWLLNNGILYRYFYSLCKNFATIYSKIFNPVLFLPLLPSLSAERKN